MTKKEFIELFGENPEDVLGGDWKNDIEDLEVKEEISLPQELKISKETK